MAEPYAAQRVQKMTTPSDPRHSAAPSECPKAELCSAACAKRPACPGHLSVLRVAALSADLAKVRQALQRQIPWPFSLHAQSCPSAWATAVTRAPGASGGMAGPWAVRGNFGSLGRKGRARAAKRQASCAALKCSNKESITPVASEGWKRRASFAWRSAAMLPSALKRSSEPTASASAFWWALSLVGSMHFQPCDKVADLINPEKKCLREVMTWSAAALTAPE